MRGVLAVCVLCSFQSLEAGTITGTEVGTADIAIQQIVRGTAEGYTYYDPVPATLTYTVFTTDLIIGGQDTLAGSFQFAVTDSVYSIDTSSIQSPGVPENESFYQITPTGVIAILDTGIYHVYSLQAEIAIVGLDVFTGWDYIQADSSGTGFEAQGNFYPNDPPAGVPEPSSVVMMAIAFMYIYFVRSRSCARSKTRSSLLLCSA